MPQKDTVRPPCHPATRGRALVWPLLLVALWGGCAKQTPPDILIILVDTLRADRVGATVNGQELTPFLSSLAAQGFLFRNAYAQSSWTNPSVATLLTSRYQSQHGLTSFQAVMAEDEVTLPEVLQQHGYATGGFVANFLVRRNLGFAQGFDQYQTYSRKLETGDPDDRRLIKARAEQINSEALSWLDRINNERPQAPVFMYLHYMEPHNPYDPADQYLDRVLGGRPRPDAEEINRRMELPSWGTFSDEQVQAVKDLYDAEVMSLDAALRSLFKELASRHFLDDCIVVVVADHGEEFREHGLMGHHQTLYEEVVRVPLIMRVPGHTGPERVDSVVSVSEIAPTVLDFAGIPAPATFEAGSLREVMGLRSRWWPFGSSSNGTLASGVAFSELIKDGTVRQRPHERAVISATDKLIVNVDGANEFYDLRADPGETNPNALGGDARARLSGGIADFKTEMAGSGAPSATHAMDADTRERMRALGYQE